MANETFNYHYYVGFANDEQGGTSNTLEEALKQVSEIVCAEAFLAGGSFGTLEYVTIFDQRSGDCVFRLINDDVINNDEGLEQLSITNAEVPTMNILKLTDTEYGQSYKAEGLTYSQAHDALREWAQAHPDDMSKIVVSGKGGPSLTVAIYSDGEGKPTDLTVKWLDQFTGRGAKANHWVTAQSGRKLRYPRSNDDLYEIEIYFYGEATNNSGLE